MTDKDFKIEFAPGCFDDFDGTQEELDQLIADITAMVENGELSEHVADFDGEEFDDLTPEVAELIFAALAQDEAELQQLLNKSTKVKTIH